MHVGKLVWQVGQPTVFFVVSELLKARVLQLPKPFMV